MNGRSKRDKGSAYGLNYTPTLSVILDPPGVDPRDPSFSCRDYTKRVIIHAPDESPRGEGLQLTGNLAFPKPRFNEVNQHSKSYVYRYSSLRARFIRSGFTNNPPRFVGSIIDDYGMQGKETD